MGSVDPGDAAVVVFDGVALESAPHKILFYTGTVSRLHRLSATSRGTYETLSLAPSKTS